MAYVEINGKRRTGGRMLSAVDPALVGPQDFLAKYNCRQRLGSEELIEGWELLEATLDRLGRPVTLVTHVTRPTGETALIFGTATDLYRWNETTKRLDTIGSGYAASGSRWQTAELNGYLCFNNGVDLPFCYRAEWSGVVPLYELREQGIARAGQMWAFGGCLWLADIWEIRAELLDEWFANPGSVITSHDKAIEFFAPAARRAVYGRAIEERFLQRIPYRRIWSDLHEPQSWKLILAARVTAGSPEVRLSRPTRRFVEGDAVQFIDRSDPVNSFSGLVLHTKEQGQVIVLDQAAQADGASGYLARADYDSQFAGFDDQMVDGDTIVGGYALQGKLLIAYDRGFLLTSATGQAGQPFVSQPLYAGPDAVAHPRLAMVVEDTYLLYRTRAAWRQLDLATRRPARVPALEANEAVFRDLGPRSDAFMSWNPLHHEVWICLPPGYADGHYGQAAIYQHDEPNLYLLHDEHESPSGLGAFPQPSLTGADRFRWFIGTHSGRIVESRDELYERLGKAYKARMIFGLLGGEGSQVSLMEVAPLLRQAACQVFIARANHPSEPSTPLRDKVLATPRSRKYRLYARAPYLAVTLDFWSATRGQPQRPAFTGLHLKALSASASTIQF